MELSSVLTRRLLHSEHIIRRISTTIALYLPCRVHSTVDDWKLSFSSRTSLVVGTAPRCSSQPRSTEHGALSDSSMTPCNISGFRFVDSFRNQFVALHMERDVSQYHSYSYIHLVSAHRFALSRTQIHQANTLTNCFPESECSSRTKAPRAVASPPNFEPP